MKPKYHTIERMVEMIDEPNRDREDTIRRIHARLVDIFFG